MDEPKEDKMNPLFLNNIFKSFQIVNFWPYSSKPEVRSGGASGLSLKVKITGIKMHVPITEVQNNIL